MLVMAGKVASLIFMMMWIRWTLPRFRFDQLMRLAWQGLIPVTLGLFVLATILLYTGHQQSPAWALSGNAVILAVALVAAGSSRTEVTGRQANLPSITAG